MASRSDAKCYTHDTWVVDIYENLLIPTNELEDLHAVIISVCRVPKSLRSSARPEAFIPQFVGLGPYHHDRPELIMTDQLKLAAVKRALKQDFHLYSEETLRQRLEIFLSDSDIQAFYHIDVSSKYNYHTLLYLLTVDGLFLLGLLHRAAATAKPAGEDSDSYFLTGKHGMALVNASGVELTMDFIIRDVFMLENQIPTHFLKQIKEAVMSNNKEIQPHVEVYQDLDETMQNFCESLCPFLLSKKPSKKPEAHHLLDLMYQLIVPEPEPESDPEPESEPMPNPELKSEPKPMSKPEPDQSVPLLDQPGPQSEVKDEQAGTKNRNTCCSMCGDILVFLVVACFIMGFIVQHILKLLLWILKSLFRIILWVLRPLYNVLVKWSYIIHPVVEALYNFLSKNDAQISLLKPWTKMVGDIKKTSEEVGRDYLTKGDKDTRQAVTIPSVTELHSAGINFQPAKGGISSIDFDHMNCQFYLPVIKLDANSEVIIRNLVAYESLTKSKGLIFTRYVELMRAIIDTPQDVKLLVLNKIIDTELSDEVVAQLFNGMSKSIRPTKTRKLEQVIKKVNAKFDSTQAQKRAMINYVSTYGKMLTAIAALAFLVLTAVQTYCSVFGCSPSSNFAGILPQGGEYASNNNHLMSSMFSSRCRLHVITSWTSHYRIPKFLPHQVPLALVPTMPPPPPPPTQDWLKGTPFSSLFDEDLEEFEKFEQEIIPPTEGASSSAINLDD